MQPFGAWGPAHIVDWMCKICICTEGGPFQYICIEGVPPTLIQPIYGYKKKNDSPAYKQYEYLHVYVVIVLSLLCNVPMFHQYDLIVLDTVACC